MSARPLPPERFKAQRAYRAGKLSRGDCGFGTFSNRPVNSAQVAPAKMKAVSEAARAAGG